MLQPKLKENQILNILNPELPKFPQRAATMAPRWLVPDHQHHGRRGMKVALALGILQGLESAQEATKHHIQTTEHLSVRNAEITMGIRVIDGHSLRIQELYRDKSTKKAPLYIRIANFPSWDDTALHLWSQWVDCGILHTGLGSSTSSWWLCCLQHDELNRSSRISLRFRWW